MKTQHSAIDMAAAPWRAAIPESEKVGVRLIRLTRATGCRWPTCTVVRSFTAVDRVLAQWSAGCDGQFECRFEIIYSDGYQISGDYAFRRKGGRRPTLSRHVRASAHVLCSGQGMEFLDRYETDDLSPA